MFYKIQCPRPFLVRRINRVNDEGDYNCRRRHVEGYSLQVRQKQDWGRGFILLLPQTAVLPESHAGSGVIKPASGFVIQKSSALVIHVVPDV